MEAQKHAVPTVVIILYNVLPHTFGFRFQFGEIEPGIIKAAVIKKWMRWPRRRENVTR